MKIINNHYVFGKEVVVSASDELEATIKIGFITTDHIWEIKTDRFNSSLYRAYVAKFEDSLPIND